LEIGVNYLDSGFGVETVLLEGMLLHHYTSPARNVENGKLVELPPRSDPEMFTFKCPIGQTLVAGMTGESLVYIHQYFPDIPNITFKEALGIEFNEKGNFLAKLGLCQTNPINVRGKMVPPWEALATVANNQPPEARKAPDIRHGGGAIVKGIKDGQKVEYNIQMWPSEQLVQKNKDAGCARFGGYGGTFRNGSPMGSIAVLMARGQIKATGCFVPGLVEPTEEFIKQEVAMGQNVEITRTALL